MRDVDASIAATISELATRVARGLIVRALEQLAGDMVSGRTLLLEGATVHGELALPPAVVPPVPVRRGKKPGKKPGPKPGAKRGRPPKARPAVTTAAVQDDGAMVRRCRKCFEIGPVSVLEDGRTVKCGACGFKWQSRAKRGERSAVAPMKRPNQRASAGDCGRCDHEASAHVGNNGRCLVPRCVCESLLR